MGNTLSSNSSIVISDTLKLLRKFGVFKEFPNNYKEADIKITQQATTNALKYVNFNFTPALVDIENGN